MLKTNDPDGLERGVHVSVMADNYAPGDAVPSFRVPSINHCAPGPSEEPCDMAPMCFDSRDPLSSGKPLLFAFFSSW